MHLIDSSRPGFRALSAWALALIVIMALGCEPASAQETHADAESGLHLVREMRRNLDRTGLEVEDTWQNIPYRGRAALEYKGRIRSAGEVRRVHDFAVFDLATRRIVVYIFFPNASRRKAGEAILPMSDIATKADTLLRAVIQGKDLALEGIERFRASGEESIYYEVRYAPETGEIRFLQPPVRLLIDATTGNLFRLDIDPDWIDPLPVPRNRIARQAAERIAAVTLQRSELASLFGPGARFGKVEGADLYYARPNAWLGLTSEGVEARSRLVWLVAFTVSQAKDPGPHSVFVDVASGRIIGGMPGSP